jgi:alkylation response protein AidB-like acyl-CoA dehydrogenase
MYDVWDVIGLNGTGTDSYSVEDLFIPENFAALRDDFSALREKGPLYGITTYTMFGLGFAAISCGVARAILDAATDLAREKASVGLKAMRENNAVQGAIGRAEGNLRAARHYIYGTAAEAWRDTARTGKLSEEHRTAIRLASTWTIHQAAAVVDAAYHMAGATAVFKSNKFERRFRDMHAIKQQIQARDTHYEDVGKALLGVGVIPRGPTT